jgi:hypothetical protein
LKVKYSMDAVRTDIHGSFLHKWDYRKLSDTVQE